ncbi:coproporphyrinogen III oxidase [Planctomycetaceae bacterium SCGC AG-212-F19]|nr:coproporphyrinogen III oxidase [Planctomycetaceae bacterium SCGC AG-212-F19]
MTPTAAYIHVPFCAHHCGYCDFAVTAGQDHLFDLYLEALAQELTTLNVPSPVDTIFIGGGTPTYLDSPRLERLLKEIDCWLPLCAGGEFSIETTPESLDPAKVAVLARHGVNRVSIGAQSFHPHLLHTLERIHDPDAIGRAVACVRKAISNVSLDLIFGVPGQSLDEWDADLRRALAFGPDHLATYGLTYEKGTPLWKQRARGAVRALDEDTELAMYERTIDLLEAAGFEHYELSNFARPGRRCRHNQVYWANQTYYGFGVGAARYVDGCRELNTRDTQLYIRKVLAGETPTFQSETLPPEERARETIAVQLRRSDGIDRKTFRQQTGYELDALVGAAVARLVDLQLLADDRQRVRLTRKGKGVADAIITELM